MNHRVNIIGASGRGLRRAVVARARRWLDDEKKREQTKRGRLENRRTQTWFLGSRSDPPQNGPPARRSGKHHYANVNLSNKRNIKRQKTFTIYIKKNAAVASRRKKTVKRGRYLERERNNNNKTSEMLSPCSQISSPAPFTPLYPVFTCMFYVHDFPAPSASPWSAIVEREVVGGTETVNLPSPETTNHGRTVDSVLVVATPSP